MKSAQYREMVCTAIIQICDYYHDFPPNGLTRDDYISLLHSTNIDGPGKRIIQKAGGWAVCREAAISQYYNKNVKLEPPKKEREDS